MVGDMMSFPQQTSLKAGLMERLRPHRSPSRGHRRNWNGLAGSGPTAPLAKCRCFDRLGWTPVDRGLDGSEPHLAPTRMV
jgi:hypothetical protein